VTSTCKPYISNVELVAVADLKKDNQNPNKMTKEQQDKAISPGILQHIIKGQSSALQK